MGRAKKNNSASFPETEEGAITELGAAAWKLARQKIEDGTASSQLLTFVLKASSPKERLEREALTQQIELTKAKTESLKDTKDIKQMYSDAMSAFKDYLGYSGDDNGEH